MLQNDAVADFLTSKFNEVAEERNFPKKFLIHDGAYSHDDNSAYINGILTLQSPEVKPIINYFWAKCTYSLEFNLSLSTGFNRIKDLNSIISDVISNINGFQFDLGDGRAIFSVKLPTTTGLEIRKVLGQSVLPKLSIEVEYSSNRDGLRYEMALIDSIFDDGSINTRWFASQTEQQAYYNEKVANGGAPYCELMTPNLNSLTLTQQMYINDLRYYPPGTENVLDTNTILQKNYAIIRAVDKDNVPVSYYYYYVQSADLGPNNQPLFSLKMDTLQTFYFDPEIVFTDCLIDRAHVNRFLDYGFSHAKPAVCFDGSAGSLMFESEDLPNLPKRLTKRTKLSFDYTGNYTANKWIEENVAFWIYVFLDKSHPYKVNDLYEENTLIELPSNFTENSFYFSNGGIYASETGVLCCPVMKTNNNMIVSSSKGPDWNAVISDKTIETFREMNEGVNNSYLYNIKFSLLPPIDLSMASLEVIDDGIRKNLYIYETETDHSELSIDTNTNLKTIILGRNSEGNIFNSYGMFTDISQKVQDIESEDYSLEGTFIFAKEDIISATRQKKFNPKLLNSNFKELVISDWAGGRFSYDIQKINSESINFLYSEPIQPEITKYYARIKGDAGLYSEAGNQSFIGLVGSIDNGLAIANEAYSQFLANNKNFWLQSNFTIAAQAITGTIDGAKSGAETGAVGGPTGAIAGAIAGGVQSLTTPILSIINRGFTIDNMKNSPASLKNANGNVIFNMYINDLGIYIEEYEALEHEINVIDDFMYKNGFIVNKLGNIRDYDNIRKYFNYVQAEIETINGVSLSNNAREDLRQRFRNGVRFWNSDNIQYNLENYENWLEDIN